MTVAYNLLDERGNERRLSAVALDGTFYCKSGLVSGGKIELEKKARRWGKKNVMTMTKERNSLLDELRKAQMIRREESEMKILESQVLGLQNQVKYIAVEEDKILKYISQITEEIQKLEEELDKCSATYKVTKAKVAEQEAKITQLQTEMEKAENEVFASFCKEIHIPNIRLYEEQGLQVMTERANKRLQFEKQKSRIQTQIKYERSRDKDADVERWRAVVEAQKVLVEKAKEEERKKVKEAEELMKAFAREKAKRVDKARVVREMEEEVELAQEKARKIRREKAKAQQKIFACKQKIKSLEVERHNILKHCHIKDVELPLKCGSLKHVALREGAPLSTSASHSSSSSSSSPTEMLSSLTDKQGGEAEIKVDFSSLPNALKKVENEEHQKKAESLMQQRIRSLEKTLSAMHAPSKNTSERVEQASDQMREMNLQLEELQQQASNAKEEFKEVKQRRYTLFMDCFSTVAAKIDEVYKGLCQSNQAQALLEISDPQEPYLGSIIYHCIPPGKRCQSMGGLSGGEKSVAALAFLFALHSYHPAPFFLLDEVDAALDRGNIRKMCEYIYQLRQNVAVVVISHRLDLYHKADALFGITYDMVNDYARSKVFSLDLTQYRKDRSWRPTDGGDGDEMPIDRRHTDSQRSDRRRRRDERHKNGRVTDEIHSAGTQRDSQCSDRRRHRDGRNSDEIHSAGTHSDSQCSDRRRHRDGRDSDEIHIAGTHSDERRSDRSHWDERDDEEIHITGTHIDERRSDRSLRDGRDDDVIYIAGTHSYSQHSARRRRRDGRDSDEIHSAGTHSDERHSDRRRHRDGRDSDEIHISGTHSNSQRSARRRRRDGRDRDEIHIAETQQ